MNCNDKFLLIQEQSGHGLWAERLVAEMGYLINLARFRKPADAGLTAAVGSAVDDLYALVSAGGAIDRETTLAYEQRLAALSPICKSCEIICAGHAHIDMNWMWGLQETAAITVDTFRTVLELMKEFPDFCFSQSQASTYRLIEQYAPEMLPEIRQRVHEGRWEVSATQWVEADANMPNGESFARHILYARDYLCKLLEIAPESLDLTFEPDTFGHSANLPEILHEGGVRYYYHCRGYEGHYLYRWEAPSGARLLVCRETNWYNDAIDYRMFWNAPEYCSEYGTDVMLRVYGVGDHGGGPTRRDLERIVEIGGWPLMAKVRFGTMEQFFHRLEAFADKLPVVKQELNYVFTGCYTSQSRIKMANRLGEDRLNDSETLNAMAAVMAGGEAHTDSYAEGWKKVLFNHFHDILPGSGVVETREYAMGQFQEALACANTNAGRAMHLIADSIDTSSVATDGPDGTISEGGGPGFGIGDEYTGLRPYNFTQTGRGRGSVRVFTLFNTTAFAKDRVEQITVWDLDAPAERLSVADSDGNPVEFRILEGPEKRYWGHHYLLLAARVKVPAFGYATYVIRAGEHPDLPAGRLARTIRRCDDCTDGDITMENELVSLRFDARTMRLLSYTDKRSGAELLGGRPAGSLLFITENTAQGMTAWRIGAHRTVVDLNETCGARVEQCVLGGVSQYVVYTMKYRASSVAVRLSLDGGSPMLKVALTVDWHELGSRDAGIPQLGFRLPFGYACAKYRYDIPMGTIERAPLPQDVPANSWALALNQNGPSLGIVTDTKYGFRGVDDSLYVDLIRSSYDPDPCPEQGRHSITLGVTACPTASNAEMMQQAAELVHPAVATAHTAHGGRNPMNGSLFTCGGELRIVAVKCAEDGRGLILRGHELNGRDATAELTFACPIREAALCDVGEKPIETLKPDGGRLRFPLGHDRMFTLRVVL